MKIRHLALLWTLSLAACGGVGSGSKPEQLQFVTSTTSFAVQTNLTAFQCITATPLLLATFTDGSVGIFNSRATYSSSNPAVVRVSDGNLPVPGQPGLFYSNGTVVAVGSKGQSARITADFAGLKANLDVTIDAYDRIDVKRQEFTASDNATRRETERMVPGTRQQLRAIATTAAPAKTIDVTAAGFWSIDAPDTTVAVIGESSAVFSALALPAGTTVPVTKTARAVFPACDPALMTTPTSTVQATSTSITLDPGAQLVIVQEPGFEPGRMINRTSQFIRTLAQFTDGSEQDLTFAGVLVRAFSTTVPTEASSSFVYSFLSSLLVAIDSGEADITASFGTDDTTTPADERLLTVAPLRMKSISATLDSIDVQPAAATIPAINPATVSDFNTQQFSALATFTPAVPADCPAPCTQPYLHDVIWTTSDTARLFISNAAASAGLAVALSNPAADTAVTVTATSNTAVSPTVAGAVPSDTAVLTIQPSP